jgi:anti-anti-sigma regulatory factor
MLRISEVVQKGDGARRLRLEGHVTDLWVAELRRVCLEALGTNGHSGSVVLDLTGLAFLDPDGVALFRDLAARQVTFINPSPFIAEQLRGVVDVQR